MDWSVCMTAIFYSAPNSTICSETAALSQTIVHTNVCIYFRDNFNIIIKGINIQY